MGEVEEEVWALWHEDAEVDREVDVEMPEGGFVGREKVWW